MSNGYADPNSKLTIDTGFNQQGNSPLTTPLSASSSIRRRQNYNITDSGPAFGSTKQLVPIFTADRQKSIQYTLHAKMDKGFFMCDGDWTCYRRNYFQASGAFTCYMANTMPTPIDANFEINPAETECYIERDGEMMKIYNYKIGITSRVAAGEKTIDLVQHTSKRDKGPQHKPEPRVIKAGGNVFQAQYHQILSSTQFVSALSNQTVVTFERLQFKSATANNGKRRAAQQYYVIVAELFADCENLRSGLIETVKIAQCSSAPLVVRGRSPGHYENGKPSPYSQNASSPYITPINQWNGSPQSNASASMYTPPVNYMSTPASETLFSPVIQDKKVEVWNDSIQSQNIQKIENQEHQEPTHVDHFAASNPTEVIDEHLPSQEASLFASTSSFGQFDDQTTASEFYGSSSLLALATENSLLDGSFGAKLDHPFENGLVSGETHQW